MGQEDYLQTSLCFFKKLHLRLIKQVVCRLVLIYFNRPSPELNLVNYSKRNYIKC